MNNDRYEQVAPFAICAEGFTFAVQFNSKRQRGAAALEFALVIPTIVALLMGIATFGAALYSKQLLYDVAGETARSCVLKSLGDDDAVKNCVVSVGNFLSSSQVHQRLCMGTAVKFDGQIMPTSGERTMVPSIFPQQLRALQVTASCPWSFSPGFAVILNGIQAPSVLSATASAPLLSDTAPL